MGSPNLGASTGMQPGQPGTSSGQPSARPGLQQHKQAADQAHKMVSSLLRIQASLLSPISLHGTLQARMSQARIREVLGYTRLYELGWLVQGQPAYKVYTNSAHPGPQMGGPAGMSRDPRDAHRQDGGTTPTMQRSPALPPLGGPPGDRPAGPPPRPAGQPLVKAKSVLQETMREVRRLT